MNIIEDITEENIEDILKVDSSYSKDFKELVNNVMYINGTNKKFAGVIVMNYALLFLEGDAQGVAANLANDYIQKKISEELPNESDAQTSWGQITRTTIENELDKFGLYSKGTIKEREIVRAMWNKLTGRN